VATDLRASAALVLAALAAKGKTTIQGLHHLDQLRSTGDENFSELDYNALPAACR